MNKYQKYEQSLVQITAIVEGEKSIISNMANVTAILHRNMNFWWTGFYLVIPSPLLHTDLLKLFEAEKVELVLGPFQGPPACTHIAQYRGVCGTAWKKRQTIVVPDVEQFPGHIACSTESKSEIVVPLIKDGYVYAVLDIDSRELNAFDEVDQVYLENIVNLL